MTDFKKLSVDEQDTITGQMVELFMGQPCYAIRVETLNGAYYAPSSYADDDPKKQNVVRAVETVTKKIGSKLFGPEAVSAHLRGEAFIGVYPIQEDSTVRFFALDFDRKEDENTDPLEESLRQAKVLREAGIPVHLERSQSGNGIHLWAFLEAPMNAGRLRHALSPLIESSDTYDRMFPNQNGVDAGRPLGNLIALPLQGKRLKDGNSAFLAYDGTELEQSQFDVLKDVDKVPLALLESLYEQAGQYAPERVRTTHKGESETMKDSWKMTHSVFGSSFIRYCWDHAATITEPEWYALACQFSQFEDGRDLFHKWSEQDSRRYDAWQCDRKYSQAVKQNKPHTCEAIRNLGAPCDDDERFKGVFHPYDLANVMFLDLLTDMGTEYETEQTVVDSRSGFATVVDWLHNVEKDPTVGQGYRFDLKDLDETCGMRPGNFIVVAARPSIGKALPNDAPVLTTSGWTTMGALGVGDTVLSGDGSPTKITHVFPQGKRQMYLVSFEDGTSCECDDEHLWLTSSRAERKKGAPASVKTLREIRQTLYTGGKERRPNHQVPWVGPAQFTEQQLPLDPYVLGVLLGDGCLTKGALVSNPEMDVMARFASRLPLGDYMCTTTAEGKQCPVHMVKGPEYRGSTTRNALESFCLLGTVSADKCVPDEYMIGSTEQRLELLRGLLDTDGYTIGSNFQFTSVSQKLAVQVLDLARSLGARATMSSKVGAYTKGGVRRECQIAYTVTMSFRNDLVPVTSEKHLKAYRQTVRCKDTGKTIVEVNETRVTDATCIMVEHPDQLFVTKDYIVTHNSAFVGHILDALVEQDVVGVFYSLEMTSKEFYTRQLSKRTSVSSTRMKKGQLTPDDWTAINGWMAELTDPTAYPVYVDEWSMSIERIFELAGRMHHEHNGRIVVIVDYLQLVQARPGENEYITVSRVSSQLKLLAKVLQIPVIGLAQLNRAADGQGTEGEALDSWLRGSGKIEQDADVILFLLGQRGPGVVERTFVIQKDRHGTAGVKFQVDFNQPLMQFGPRGKWMDPSRYTGFASDAPTVSPDDDDLFEPAQLYSPDEELVEPRKPEPTVRVGKITSKKDRWNIPFEELNENTEDDWEL